MRYHGHLVELACYKDPLKKQWNLCVGAKKDTDTAVAWQQLEQDKLNSVRNIRGAAQKN